MADPRTRRCSSPKSTTIRRRSGRASAPTCARTSASGTSATCCSRPNLRARIPEGAVESLVTPWLDDARWLSFFDRLMAINIAWKGAGHIPPKAEHLGLRLGVRARSPLFDRDVVALAFAIPSGLKRFGTIEKHLLKEAVRDLLLRAILERPKSGMLVPVEAWFSGPLLGWARERLLDGLAPRGLVERGFLERLRDARLGGLRPRRGVKIWLLLTLESWLRQVLDGTAKTGPAPTHG